MKSTTYVPEVLNLSGQAVAVNLDIEPAEPPQTVLWVDPTHPHGAV